MDFGKMWTNKKQNIRRPKAWRKSVSQFACCSCWEMNITQQTTNISKTVLMLFAYIIAKIGGAQTLSACKLLVKRPRQNDPPAMKLQDVLIHKNMLTVLYNTLYVGVPSAQWPPCTVELQLQDSWRTLDPRYFEKPLPCF